MIYLLFFIICFAASVVGAICGIGGGVIIKPLLDSFGIMNVETISFLSGCTVLAMTTYSVIRSKINGKSRVETKIGLPLAIGGAAGGLLGKWLFSVIIILSSQQNKVGAIQAICLLAVTVGTLLYTLGKDKIKTYKIENVLGCILIGIMLGALSSFLGIGGGPINLVVLFFFFSMSTKTAAENSLYIIFFSQITSLISSIIMGNVPRVQIVILFVMILGGITGGMCGRGFNKKITDKTVDRLFIALMIVMILINIYNIYKFTLSI